MNNVGPASPNPIRSDDVTLWMGKLSFCIFVGGPRFGVMSCWEGSGSKFWRNMNQNSPRAHAQGSNKCAVEGVNSGHTEKRT